MGRQFYLLRKHPWLPSAMELQGPFTTKKEATAKAKDGDDMYEKHGDRPIDIFDPPLKRFRARAPSAPTKGE